MNFGWDQQTATGAYAYQIFGSYESAVPSSQLSPELEPGPWQSQPLDPFQARGWHSDPWPIDSGGGTLSSNTPALSSLSSAQHIPFEHRNTLSGSQHPIGTETNLHSQYSHYYVNNKINTCGYQVSNNIPRNPNMHLNQSVTNPRDPSHGGNTSWPVNSDPKTLNLGHQQR
jgi:hypothetical protein